MAEHTPWRTADEECKIWNSRDECVIHDVFMTLDTQHAIVRAVNCHEDATAFIDESMAHLPTEMRNRGRRLLDMMRQA